MPKLECNINMAESDESTIRGTLERAFPQWRWEESDSSWDKVNVRAEAADASVRVYRYEGPGPFRLTISAADPLALRDAVLQALGATLWKRLEPQPVALVKVDGRFPPAYAFDSDRDVWQIKRILDDAAFWLFEAGRDKDGRVVLLGRPNDRAANPYDQLRISGEPPTFIAALWPNAADAVHETVQTTILPAIGARNVRAARDQ